LTVKDIACSTSEIPTIYTITNLGSVSVTASGGILN
jgi:hypothetical protein